MSLKVGVIGVGHLGSRHAELMTGVEGARLVGVHDVDPSKGRSVADKTSSAFFERLDDLLAGVDAVTVAAVTSAHFAIVAQALRAGKHVLVEKPITQTADEARQLNAIAREKGLVLQVGHIERFNPAVLALEPFLLQPLFIESHRLAQFDPRGTDVAVVLDLMIHDIDLILSLVRSPVSRIDANGVAVVSDHADIANARIQFENGCVANVTASRISQNKLRKMRLFQKDAYISIDFAQPLAEVFRIIDEGTGDAEPTMMLGKITQGSRKRVIVYERPEVAARNALQEELRSFVACISTNGTPVVTGEDGQQALEVAAQILSKIEG